MDIFEALAEAGFSKVGETTASGYVQEYTFFNADGVRVDINYRRATTRPLSWAGIEMAAEDIKCDGSCEINEVTTHPSARHFLRCPVLRYVFDKVAE